MLNYNPASVIANKTPFFYGWMIVFTSSLSMFVRNAAATLTIAVFVYPMSEDLGWSRTLIVGAAAASGVASMFISPLAGWILQKFGSKFLISISLFLLGLVILSIRWTTNPITFYLLFGTGRLIFQAPLQIGPTTVVAQWFIKLRGRASSILGVSHSLGMGLFPLFAQLFINANYGDWRMAWFWIGISVWIIALPLTLLLLINKPEDIKELPDGITKTSKINSKTNTEEQWTLQDAVKTPTLWLLALAGGLVFFIHTGVNIHQAAFLRDSGISASAAASALAIMAGGSAIGSIIWGNLLDKFSVKLVYSLAAGWLGITALLFLQVNSTTSAFIVAIIFGIGLGGLLVIPPVAMAHYFGRQSLGAIRGITEPFVSGGQAIGAIAAGVIFDISGSYDGTFPVFTVAAIIAIALIISARKPKKNTR